jgi:carbonic anhydrase/acetyltransferase-like protein (isoleucine patch superfamily)
VIEINVFSRKKPVIPASVYLSSDAYVAGDVVMGEECSVWPFASVRGDEESIRIGDRTNVQDGVVIHVDSGFPTDIGDDVTIGHGAIVHGATVGNRCIIGIGSTILNGSIIGGGSIVGAGAVVTPGSEIPPNSMVLGIPGKVKKKDPSFSQMAVENARIYVDLSRDYMKM